MPKHFTIFGLENFDTAHFDQNGKKEEITVFFGGVHFFIVTWAYLPDQLTGFTITMYSNNHKMLKICNSRLVC